MSNDLIDESSAEGNRSLIASIEGLPYRMAGDTRLVSLEHVKTAIAAMGELGSGVLDHRDGSTPSSSTNLASREIRYLSGDEQQAPAKDEVDKICQEWCEITKLELEHAFYSKMIIQDVNNYIAVKEGYTPDKKKDDYIKRKGLFEYNIDYHKNPSFLVIPKAIEAHFIDGIDYREYILSNKDIYDFCAGVKTRKDFKLNLYKIEDNQQKVERQQKVTRYFCSTKGGILMKDYTDGRQISINSEQYVTVCNNIDKDKDYLLLLDYGYYMAETRKIIDKIVPPRAKIVSIPPYLKQCSILLFELG